MLYLAVLWCHTIDLQVEHTALLLLSRDSVIAASAVEKSRFQIAILSQMQLIVQPYYQSNLGFHTTSAVPQTDYLHATPNWGRN